MTSKIKANPRPSLTKAVNPAPKWDVRSIIHTLFGCTPDKGVHFYPVLLQEDIYEVKDLFDAGTLGPRGIVNIFGSQSSTYRMHLAIMLTFTSFVETRISGLVDLGTNPDEDAWISTVRKNFRSAAFKIFRDRTLLTFLQLIEDQFMVITPNPTLALQAQSIPNPKSKVTQPQPPPPRTTSHMQKGKAPPPPPQQVPIPKMPPPPQPQCPAAQQTPIINQNNTSLPPITPPNTVSAPYFSPPAQRLSIQEAYQQANPWLFGAEQTTTKLKERSALPYKISWKGKIGTFETH